MILSFPVSKAGKDLHLAGRVVGGGQAPTAALSAVVAGGPPVQRPCDHGSSHGDAGYTQLLAGFPDDPFMGLGRRGRLKNAVRGAADSLPGPCDSDEGLGLVVVGRKILVGNGPVGPQTIPAVGVKVVIGKPQRDPPVMVGPPSHNPGAEPQKVAALGDGVGFSLQGPTAPDRTGVKMAEGLSTPEVDASALLRSPMIHFMGPDVLLEVGQRVQHGAGLQQGHPNPQPGQHVGDGSTARAGPDHDHFVLFRTIFDVSHAGIQTQLDENWNLSSRRSQAASKGRTRRGEQARKTLVKAPWSGHRPAHPQEGRR